MKVFNDFQNRNFCFMTKVKPNNVNETKSDIFPSRSKSLSFMTKAKPNNENETKSDIFP